MGESPLVDSVSSGRTPATTSPIRNAVGLAGLENYLTTRVGASWIAGMKLVGEPRWTGVPPRALRRCQPFLSTGSTATPTKPGVRRITTPRSAVPLVLRIMTHNNLPDCPLSSTVLRCCPTTAEAFRRLALASIPPITTGLIRARITMAIRTSHQSQRCLSMGRCDQKIQSFRQLFPSRINTLLAPRISSHCLTHLPGLLPGNSQMANNSGDRGRGRRPLVLGGVAGRIMLLKSWRVISAEVRTPGPLFWCCLRDRFDPGVTLLRLDVGP